MDVRRTESATGVADVSFSYFLSFPLLYFFIEEILSPLCLFNEFSDSSLPYSAEITPETTP